MLFSQNTCVLYLVDFTVIRPCSWASWLHQDFKFEHNFALKSQEISLIHSAFFAEYWCLWNLKDGVQCLSNNALSGIPALRTMVCYLSKWGELALTQSMLCIWLHLRLYIICSASINWFGCVLFHQGQLYLLGCVSSSTLITGGRRKIHLQITAQTWKNLWFFS